MTSQRSLVNRPNPFPSLPRTKAIGPVATLMSYISVCEEISIPIVQIPSSFNREIAFGIPEAVAIGMRSSQRLGLSAQIGVWVEGCQ